MFVLLKDRNILALGWDISLTIFVLVFARRMIVESLG